MTSFVCTTCRSPLTETPADLKCPSCGIRYPRKNGIPFFCKGDYYFVEIAETEMDRLLDIIRTEGWKAALHDHLRFRDRGTYAISCDESRLDWRFLYPINKSSTVLDMGCGWGGISLSLAQRAGQVVSMDVSEKRLTCLDLRAREEKIANITTVCGGDTLILPFADKTFDLIVLNGVLEWLGIFHREMTPRDVQLAKLREIRRILKDDGAVYIGIENRIGYVYFLGGRDHNKLRFTTLMPRPMADWYTRLRTGEPYRTYTYSPAGYRTLLAEAGFSKLDIYATIPSYRDVFFLAHINDTNALDFFFARLLQARTVKRRIIRFCARALLRAGIFKHIFPEIGMTARK